MLNRVREDREREREQKKDLEEWWDKEMYVHSLFSAWCNYKRNCFKLCGKVCFPVFKWWERRVYSGVFLTFLPCRLNSRENKRTMPTQAFNTRATDTDQQGVECKTMHFSRMQQPKTENSHNFKAQSHTLIWILKLSRCRGASNSGFCKTIIMTNVCISSLPNPLSMSLAWGDAAEKLTQICYMWLANRK